MSEHGTGRRARRGRRRVGRHGRWAALAAFACLLASVLPSAAGASVGAAVADRMPSALPAQTPPTGTLTWSVRPTPTEAQPERPNFSFDLDDGATVQDSVRVRNFGNQPLTMAIYASDALTTKSGALDLLPAAKQPRDVGAWISLAANGIEVAPNEFVDVPFTLVVPPGTLSGDHTGGIVTSVSTPVRDATNTPVMLDRRLGTRVQVRVNGPLRPRLEITELSAEYGNTLNPVGAGTLDVTYTIRNTGNVRVTAGQSLKVTGAFGLTTREVRLGDMPELLPTNSLTFTAKLDDVWPTVHLGVEVEVRPRTTSDRGPLPVTVAAATRSAGVWAIPWVLLAILVIGIGGPVLWRWSRRRRDRTVDAQVQQAVSEALRRHAAATGEPSLPEEPAPVSPNGDAETGAPRVRRRRDG